MSKCRRNYQVFECARDDSLKLDEMRRRSRFEREIFFGKSGNGESAFYVSQFTASCKARCAALVSLRLAKLEIVSEHSIVRCKLQLDNWQN